jgi:hypothetical protein
MSPVRYDGRFVPVFERELRARHSPSYPAALWHAALAAADLEQPCVTPRKKIGTDQMWNDESTKTCGYAERNYDGSEAARIQLDKAISAFWARRYGF